MAKSDYKYQFVNTPPDDVICPLCLDIVEEPHQFTCCGQHICKKCGDKIKQQDTTPRCPLCRHSEYGTVHDKYFERNVLNKLLIWCTEGCGQKVELGQLKNHLPQCLCVIGDCPYGCGQQYQRQYIEEHKEECPKRPFICSYCKYQSTYEVIVNEHYPVCDKYPIICPNECSRDEIERGMLQDHLDKCPFQVVECEFSYVGCQEKVRRCDLVQHLSDNGVHHTALSSKMIYESLQKITEEKDRQLQEKDRQLQEKEIQLAKKDNELKVTVQQKDKQLQEKEIQLAKKDNELKVTVQQKDKQLQEKNRQLQEKETQLAKKDNELRLIVQQKDKEIREKDRQLLQAKDHFLSEVREIRGENKSLLSAIYDKICDDTVLSVTMTEFKRKKDNRVRWFSPPYFTHLFGYKMCFEVDFNCDESRTSLLIDSYMMRGPYDDHLQWPFKGKVIVRLLNQVGDHNHYDYVFDYKDKEQGKRVTSEERGTYLPSKSTYLPFEKLDRHPKDMDDLSSLFSRPLMPAFKVPSHRDHVFFPHRSSAGGHQNLPDDNQYLLNDCLKFKVIIPRYH